MSEALLELRALSVCFDGPSGPITAADRVSFEVPRGSAVGLVGESGSGKSVTALSILGLTRARARSVSGEIRYGGRDLLRLPEPELRRLRGAKLAMIFQDPMASLNPAHTIGAQVAEPLRVHRLATRAEAARRAVALLAEVGIPDPAARARAYPHQLSGGMRQRAMIAMALACEPELLIADEPTTAVDVTVQAQIIELLRDARARRGASVLLITHDLGLVAELCDRVVVMYAGGVVEEGPTAEVLTRPRHRYTAGLLASTPIPGAPVARLRAIPGAVPDLARLPPGCRFQDRCAAVQGDCRAGEPPRTTLAPGHTHRCLHPLDEGADRR